MIRIDAMWLATEPENMRAGPDRLLALVVAVFGAARAHHGYVSANVRGTQLKLLVNDGFGVWCATRRLHLGRFLWTTLATDRGIALTRQQFDALVVGLPWARLEEMQRIAYVCCRAASLGNSRMFRWRASMSPAELTPMIDLSTLKAEDLQGLSPGAVAELAARMLAEIKQLCEQADRDAQTIRFKDAKLEKITFELARLKAWKFGAHTERLNAEQRQMFETTAAEDEADLAAQLEALQSYDKQTAAASTGKPKEQPRRKPLPDHLRRVEHHHEPADTTCGCGQAMSRIGEDVSERLDVIPAEFFVHRHIRGKWACRCCQALVQEPVDPQIVDKGVPTAGLVAHTMIGHFIGHLPYYRLEQVNARSGVVAPRSTLASWSGAGGAVLALLYDAHRAFILGARVLHADETPVALLDPGAGKTRKAYVWAYARGAFDSAPGVVYDFCISRGARHAVAFLDGWNGTLTCDDYRGYDIVFKLGDRVEAGCLAHARRRFDELLKAGTSAVAVPALQRIEALYRIEQEIAELPPRERLAARKERSLPLWNALHAWIVAERRKVPDGGGASGALDYSLNRWDALGCFLADGEVSIDNNHCENLIRPWAMGRNKANSGFMLSRRRDVQPVALPAFATPV